MHIRFAFGALLTDFMTASFVTADFAPAGAKVHVATNSEAAKFLAEVVMGRDRMNGGTTGQWAAEENADNRFKNRAAERGADTVLLSTAQRNTSGAVKRDEANRCSAPAAQ